MKVKFKEKMTTHYLGKKYVFDKNKIVDLPDKLKGLIGKHCEPFNEDAAVSTKKSIDIKTDDIKLDKKKK